MLSFTWMMVRRAVFLCLMWFTSSSMLAACRPAQPECQDPLGCVVIAPGDSLRLGYLLPLSGPFELLGADALRGIEMAVADRGGALLRHPIELRAEEANCSHEELLAAATRLATRANIIGAIGPLCPQYAAPAADTLGNAGLAAVGLAAALPETGAAGRIALPGFFRLGLDESRQGQLAADFATGHLDVERAATIDDGSPYSKALVEAFSQHFVEAGGVISFHGSLSTDEADALPLLEVLADDPPELIYLPVFPRQGNLVLIEAQGFPELAGTAFLAADSSMITSFTPDSGPAAGEIYLTGPALDTSAYADFLDRWIDRYGEAPQGAYHLLAYDATVLLLEGIARVAERSREGSLSVGRQALRASLASGQTSSGLSGIISCQPDGNCPVEGAYAVYKLSNAGTSLHRWPFPLEWVPGQ